MDVTEKELNNNGELSPERTISYVS